MRGSPKLLCSSFAALAVAGVVALLLLRGGDARPPSPAALAARSRLELILAGIAPKSEADAFNANLARRAQRLTAACMRERGFQYREVDPAAIMDTETETDFSSLAYARRHGFGISAWPTFAPDTSGNRAYAKSLPAARAHAYDDALSGCAEKAGAQANQELGVAEANKAYDAKDARLQRSDEYQRAQAAWRACARQAGYDAPSRSALMDALRAERDQLSRKVTGDAEVAADQRRQRLLDADPAFQAFRRKEIAAAVATFDCSRKLDAVYARLFQSLPG